METVRLVLLVCQLRQAPPAQSGRCESTGSIQRDGGADFLLDAATAVLQAGLAVADTTLRGGNTKGSSGKCTIPQTDTEYRYLKNQGGLCTR